MYDVTPVTTGLSTACGAACMRMLLLYYGTDVDLDTLIDELNVRLIGCSGADLMRVGRAHGLDMTAWRMDADELIRQDRPAIVHWRYQHWVVFCGTDGSGNVVIANPSRGRYGIDAESFATLYSGVALFDGEPVDGGEPEPMTVADLAEAMADLSETVSDNSDAIADLSEVVSDLAGGDIDG